MSDFTDPAVIQGYHAHVYYDDAGKAAAEVLRGGIERRFGDAVKLGRRHDGPVGPHPMGSYQNAFDAALFADIVPWLALNRGGLVVLVHPETGDDLRDHRDRALWLGAGQTLDFSIFDDAGAG